ncbi:MAG TPA: VIT1/CCC1 transporter family protein, partial [Cyclobacteriaceae bacterium]
AHQSALIIAGSYIIGGLIPLSAYFFTDNVHQGLMYSSVITFFCLIGFGLIKSKLTGQPLFKGALRVTLVGALAAAAAFGLAKLIA